MINITLEQLTKLKNALVIARMCIEQKNNLETLIAAGNCPSVGEIINNAIFLLNDLKKTPQNSC